MVSFASGTKYYLPVTLTNNQSSPTPANFQQLVTLNPSSYSSYLASDLSNANWQDGSGNVLKSWRESGTSSSDTSDNWWINLGSLTIPASGTLIIYFCFYVTTQNVLNNTNAGVAPQLTSTYGQYDNGASVFFVYDGFAGTSLNTALWQTIGSASISVDNHLYVNNGNSQNGFVVSKTTYAYPLIAETLVNSYNVTSGGPAMRSPQEALTISDTSGNGTLQESYALGNQNSSDVCIVETPSSGSVAEGTTVSMSLPGIAGIQWQATGEEYGLINNQYNSTLKSTDSTNTIANYYLVAIGMQAGGGGAGNTTIQWFRARLPPPNATMPSASAGTATQVPTVLAVSVPTAKFSITPGGNANLSVHVTGGTPPYTIEWYLKSPLSEEYQPFTGSLSKFTESVPGYYRLYAIATDSKGNSLKSGNMVVNVNTTLRCQSIANLPSEVLEIVQEPIHLEGVLSTGRAPYPQSFTVKSGSYYLDNALIKVISYYSTELGQFIPLTEIPGFEYLPTYVYTDSSGNASMCLPAGTFNVQFTKDGYVDETKQIVIVAPNSHPVKLNTSTTPTPPPSGSYNVTFSETGLPSGYWWTVTLGDSTQTTYSGKIRFGYVAPGTYQFKVSTNYSKAPSPASGTVVVTDTSVLKSILISSVPGYIIIADSSNIYILDPTTLTVIGTISGLSLKPSVQSTYDGKYVYIPGTLLYQINTLTMTVRHTLSLSLSGLTYLGGYIYGVDDAAHIYKIDPSTLTIVASNNITYSGISLTTDGTYLYSLVTGNEARIIKINPSTLSVMATITNTVNSLTGQPGIIYNGTYIYANDGSSYVIAIDPSTFTVVQTSAAVGNEGNGPTSVNDAYLFYADVGPHTSTVYQLSLSSLAITASLGISDTVANMMFDGTYLIVITNTGNKLYQVDPSTLTVVNTVQLKTQPYTLTNTISLRYAVSWAFPL